MTKKRASTSRKPPVLVPVECAGAAPLPEAADTPPDVTAAGPVEEPAKAAAVLELGSSCTLAEVAALREACIAALEWKDPPVLDGTNVERVDTAGVQVLVGFTIDCMERSINFSWKGRSPELVRGIRLLGVEALLESPGVAASPMGGVA